MIRVPTSKLEPGMILAAPVRHPAVASHVLLQTHYRLDTDSISGLKKLRVDSVWVNHPGFDFLDDKISDAVSQARTRLYESVKTSFTGISKKTAGAFNLNEYRTHIGNMILILITNKDNAVWAERLMDDDNELFAHSSNVAYLSIVIGMQITDYISTQRKFVQRADSTDLTNLGIGAMLHDVGKLGLEKEWHHVHVTDAESETDEYRSHAERGYKAVQGKVEATASQVLLHHHQRFDGLGFPVPKSRHKERTLKPMCGENIHIFSRIVAVANVIDALTSACKKSGRPIVTGLSALTSSPLYEGAFDPVVLNAGLRAIPPFPLGSFVELSDGNRAIVTDLNETSPCQPKVQLIDYNLGRSNTVPEEIDLSDGNCPLSIVKVADIPVSPKHFYSLPGAPSPMTYA